MGKYFSIAIGLILLACGARGELSRGQFTIENANVPLVRESGTFLILLDKSVLHHLYPETLLLSDEALETWALERASFMRKSQTEANGVNDPIPVATGPVPSAFAPDAYSKALPSTAGSAMRRGGRFSTSH